VEEKKTTVIPKVTASEKGTAHALNPCSPRCARHNWVSMLQGVVALKTHPTGSADGMLISFGKMKQRR